MRTQQRIVCLAARTPPAVEPNRWIAWAEPVSKWVTVVALLGAGGWALYNFEIRRESETALSIELSLECVPAAGERYLQGFDVTLTNKGHVGISAERSIPAYSDKSETVMYAGDLIVRRIPDTIPVNAPVSWFPDAHQTPVACRPLSPLEGDIEMDLLREYRDDDGCTDFWIEPGESYHVGKVVCLAPGNYLAMVTFYGTGPKKRDFWRRVHLFRVPSIPPDSRLPQPTPSSTSS